MSDATLTSVDEIEAYRLGIDLAEAKLANWMSRAGFATGHGDTFDDLLRELGWQVEELRLKLAAERIIVNRLTAENAVREANAMIDGS